MLEKFKDSVANRLGLERSDLCVGDRTLGELLGMSPVATNSIDLLEAVAAAIAECDLGDRVDIPAFTLDHTVDELMTEIERQLSDSGRLPA